MFFGSKVFVASALHEPNFVWG